MWSKSPPEDTYLYIRCSVSIKRGLDPNHILLHNIEKKDGIRVDTIFSIKLGFYYRLSFSISLK